MLQCLLLHHIQFERRLRMVQIRRNDLTHLFDLAKFNRQTLLEPFNGGPGSGQLTLQSRQCKGRVLS